ncbi:MAG: peroxiredoxin [Bdellovibrionales bacterium]
MAKAVKNKVKAAKKSAKPVLKLNIAKANAKIKVVGVGDTIPAITVAATGGKTVNLKEHAGQKVVLYFYPKDLTPGCTIEGHEFTKLQKDFKKIGTVVYGVSRDTVALHEKFKEKECYTIDLLSDVDEVLCNTFDVIKDKNMYGKIVKGIERSTFVIDGEGKVIKEWRKVKAEGHAQEVFNFIIGMK